MYTLLYQATCLVVSPNAHHAVFTGHQSDQGSACSAPCLKQCFTLFVHAGRGASSGVGFAIPVDSVKGLVEQILKFGRVIRPVLGITIAPPQTVRQLGLDGVLVLEAPSGSPASQAGIKGTFRYRPCSFASVRALYATFAARTCMQL